MTQHELSLLAKKYLSGKATEEEKKILSDWYNSFDEELTVTISDEESEAALEQRMKNRLEQILSEAGQPAKARTSNKKFYRRIAALALLLVGGVGVFFIWRSNKIDQHPGNKLLVFDKTNQFPVENREAEEGENEEEKEDGIKLAQEREFEMTKDVSLGYIPLDRLLRADNELITARRNGTYARLDGTEALSWTERGPNADAIGPSNGNTRGTQTATDAVTGGRIRAIWVDLADPTNHTIWVGGVDGGLWKTTDITSAAAGSWAPVNDFLGNLAIASICQDPTNTDVMYFGTGEKTFNTDAVLGGGVWRSTDHGINWDLLTNTTGFTNVSRVLCDAAGNVYVSTVASGSALGSVQRSTNGGASWTNITPTGLTSGCTEMKLGSNGRLHVVLGYLNAGTSGYRYTDIPATVTSGTWTSPTTVFSPVTRNTELAIGGTGTTLYALPAFLSGSSYFTPTIYKSTDGGTNWAPCTTSPPSTGTEPSINTGQGWYDLALGVDPNDDNNVVAGGLNFYRTANGGTTWSQITRWVDLVHNYVHADHHIVVWNGTQVLVGTDGGLFYSNNNGVSFVDRNDGLRIKQFYSCAIHPSTTNYFLAGAQDNGNHQLTNAGLGGSIEVVGGDGAIVHIDQDEPSFQWVSYVFGQYYRSTNGGTNWTSVNFSSSLGQFINPTDYDDIGNKMYTGSAAGEYVRWENPQSGSTFYGIAVPAFNSSAVTSVTVSPYTANRVFFGTAGGRIVRVDNAQLSSPTATNITQGGMSAQTVSSVAVGTTDNNLLATFSNYGSIHIWVTTNGSTWTNITGTGLPDIPVRSAMFFPEDNTKAILATEMGIYETSLINGSSTAWVQNSTFPVVKTNMLQYRKSDGTVAAATHGRGLWTTTIPFTNPYVRFATNYNRKTESTTSTTSVCRNYTDYVVNMNIDQAPTGNANLTLSVAGGATATQGVDFDFTTNGSFASPSNTLTFANAATTPQPVTIRIYNDADVEPEESFTLIYSIGGGTNALAAPSSTSYTFTIVDNDIAPIAPFSGSNYAAGTNAASITAQSPFQSNLTRFRIQSLFTAAELQASGIVAAASITAMNIRVITKNSTNPYTGFTISMGNTTATTLSTGFISPTFTQVYSNDYTSAVGDNLFTFTTPFSWDGTSNVVVQFCYTNSTPADALADVMEGNGAPFGSGVRATTYSNATTGIGCTLAAAFISDSRIRAIFTASGTGTAIETVLNSNKTEYVGNNDSYYFYNGNKIISKLNNVSADLGCVTSNLFEVGNTWQPFLGGFRSQKVFDIAPTTNSNATYTVGLYFTAAELSTYVGSPASLRIAKTTAATMAAANSGNTVKASGTTFTPFGTGYLFTATFTGFSKFFLIDGAVTLPVTLLSFNGHLDNKTIPLDWSTSQELSSSHFEIEKSTNGSDFHYLGRVTAAGSSISQRNYNFIDRQVMEYNYYRLKMVDIDGRFVYSNTILIKNPDAVQQIFVVNNPFQDYIDLRLTKMPRQPIQLELLSMSGARVYSKEYAMNDQVRLDLSGIHLSTGSYVLRARVDGKWYMSKVVKQQ